MLQPRCCAAYKATMATQCLMKSEIVIFMKGMQDATALYLVLMISPIKFSPVIAQNFNFFLLAPV